MVQRIGIRSSTVQSLDGAEVIVPNSALVSGTLINWTHSDARRRLELTVGASYAHDPTEVMKVLRQVVGGQSGLLHMPPPEVICTAFGDSSIDYSVRGWCVGYLEAIEAKSLLAGAIHAEFAKQGIEIPFPQQDVHIISMPKDRALGDGEDT
ncbi:MAG: potassium efflux system protein [Polyangiales bacterium]